MSDLMTRLHESDIKRLREMENEVCRLQSDLTQSAEREAALLGKVEEANVEITILRDQLTESQQLAADRLVQMEQLQASVRKLSAIIMLANPEGSDKYEFAYLTKALMDGPEFCEKLDAAMQEAKS